LDGADPNGTGVLPTNGSTVSIWRDKSGNARNLTGSGTPTFLSGGGINFNGTNAFYTNTNFAYNLSIRSVFLVAKLNTYKQYAGLITFIPNPSSGVDQNSITGMSVETATSSAVSFMQYLSGPAPQYGSALTATLTNVNLYNDNMNGTIGSGFVNGNTITNITTASTAGTTSGFGVGTRWQGSMSLLYLFTGNIYDIILYTGPLTTSQRQRVEGYLAWKWGFVANLPSTHPFKNSPLGLPNPSPQLPRSVVSRKFIPTQLSSCILWLDAADTSNVILSGTGVSQWSDKSGNGKHATQTNASYRPTYETSGGYRCISFRSANTQHLIGTPLLTSLRYSLFFVFDTLTPNNLQFVFFDYKKGAGGTGQNFLQHPINANTITTALLYAETPSTQKFSSEATIGTTRIQTAIVDSPTNLSDNFYVNGAKLTTNLINGGVANIATDAIGYTLGAIRTGATATLSLTLNGNIYEVLAYLTELSMSQRQQVEGYLAWKWGLVGSLPSTHPFKLFPPPP
jgi:hypothetical protein